MALTSGDGSMFKVQGSKSKKIRFGMALRFPNLEL
jgi:hypothetical protein